MGGTINRSSIEGKLLNTVHEQSESKENLLDQNNSSIDEIERKDSPS